MNAYQMIRTLEERKKRILKAIKLLEKLDGLKRLKESKHGEAWRNAERILNEEGVTNGVPRSDHRTWEE